MKISGFTMVRNADKFYFPIKASIESVLPLVDEFVVALGDNSPGDKTREIIESIGSDKIKIIDRVWDEKEFVESRIFASETSFALSQCSGDWCLYMQADEALHEQDHETIKSYCEKYVNDKRVDGFLFNYNHFWGDYDHYLPIHGWYKNEIRLVRNNENIYSYGDAQSFRKGENQKLAVIPIPAYVYHYGWVRPPQMMAAKKEEHDSIHHGREEAAKKAAEVPDYFQYGPLGRLPVFKGSHPKVMGDFIAQLNWKDKLDFSSGPYPNRPKLKHERTKYKVLQKLENIFNGGKDFFGYANWTILKK